MSSYLQTYQPIRVETTLGPETLLLQGFHGVEGLSIPYEFDLELLSAKENIDTKAMLRTPATITFELADGSERKTHGLIGRFYQLGRQEDMTAYGAKIVPWLWFLSMAHNNKIYQQLSVIDIVEKVFKDHGYSDFTIKCRGRPKREYCVQYNESDLNFVSRLLEEEGIFYFFEHENNRHMLVLADANNVAKPIPGRPIIRFHQQRIDSEDTIWALNHQHSVHPGKFTSRDYDYLQPALTLEATVEGGGPEEVYVYPGNYTTPEEGNRLARIHQEANEAEQYTVKGEGNCRSIHAGCTIELAEHYRAEFNREYLLVHVEHFMTGNLYRSGTGSEERGYRNTFLAIPVEIPYRAPRRAVPPVMRGTQTAMVVGPAGEEVYTDKHGRVKIQFYWDRHGQKNENSSCWVRVVSPWAGKGYGNITIPRIGNEVLVDFLEGDPNRPIVVGCVYNADQVPPFTLPAAGIQMGVKSRSSKGGGGYNEITVTDTKGKELITIHGQYDMSTTIEHDNTISIGNDETTSIGANRSESVGKNESVSIGKDRTENVAKNEMVSIGENRSVSVGKNESLSVAKDRDQSIGGKENVQVGDARTTQINKDDQLTVGKKLTITVSDEILIKTGSASIQMKKDGTITIKGKDIKIEASGKISAKASSDITLKGSQIKQN